MGNNWSEASWEKLKEYLEEQIVKAKDQQGLADEQLAVINKMILEPLRRTDMEPLVLLGTLFTAFLVLGWLKLGFLPSQFEPFCHGPGLELSATFFRMFPTSKASDAPSPSGVSQFWDGIICTEMYNWDDAKNAFDLCLDDPSLPLWMRVTALQLKAWHHVRLQEYDTARETLQQLRDNLSVSKPTADYLMGYTKALEDSERGSLHYELHHDEMFVMVPEATPGELQFLPQEVAKIELAESIETLTLAITERLEPRLRLAIWQAKEEIIGSMPFTHTREEVSQRLRKDYGDWVSKLANQGDLINAEFLYEALSAKSWRGVVFDYTKVVEAEIKARLLPQLGGFLMGKGTSLDSIEPWKEDSKQSVLGYTEIVLRKISEPLFVSKLLSSLPSQTVSFLCNELPESLANLRRTRNRAVHEFVNAKDAKDTRKLVLGTPEKPGLLKRLIEINIPYTG